MIDITLFIISFIALGLFYLYLGVIASRKINSTNDYFLAGRTLTIPAVTFTLIATQLGGGMLLGTAEEAYLVGWSGILYTLGICCGFLLLGFGFAERLRSLHVSTTAELFESKYDSPFLKKVASLLSIVTLGGIFIAQVVGSRKFLISIGLTNFIPFILFWSFTIIYTMLGGLQAVVFTDMAQVIMILCVFGGLFFYSILIDPASFFKLFASVTVTDVTHYSSDKLLTIIAMPALFSLIEQDLAQRFFAARSPAVARYAALGSALFIFLFACIPVYFGILAQTIGLEIPSGASPLMPIIMNLANNVVIVLAACSVVAAINSTADSLLCAISSNIAQDFSFSWWNVSTLKKSKWITLLVGIFGIVASYIVPQNLIELLIGSYEISVYCLLIPLLACYFCDCVYKEAAIGSFISLFAALIYYLLYPTTIPRMILFLMASGTGYIIGFIVAQYKKEIRTLHVDHPQ